MGADISVKGCKIRIISCYAPTLFTPISIKQSFYRELSNLSNTEGNRKLLVQGDFNAELQISRKHSCFDGGKSRVED